MLQKKIYWLCGVHTPVAIRLFGYDVVSKLWVCLSVNPPDQDLDNWVNNTLRKYLFNNLIKGNASFIQKYLAEVNMFDDSDEFNSFIETVNAITEYVEDD